MTDLIQEVKEALQAATPGPWISTDDAVRIPRGEWICQLYDTTEAEGEIEFNNQEANAELIANTPTWLQQLLDRLETAERQREEAVKALEWYGDIENYKGVFQPTGFQVYIKPVEEDKGKLARTTLKRIKGENG